MSRIRLTAALGSALVALTCSSVALGATPVKNPATVPPTLVKLYIVKGGPAGHRQVLALVKIKINGHPFVFALDTGATGSLISAKAAKVFNLPTNGKEKSSGVKCTFVSQTVKVDNWSIGKLQLPPQTLSTSELPFKGISGLLGSDVLSKYSTISIDYQHGILKLSGSTLHGKK